MRSISARKSIRESFVSISDRETWGRGALPHRRHPALRGIILVSCFLLVYSLFRDYGGRPVLDVSIKTVKFYKTRIMERLRLSRESGL